MASSLKYLEPGVAQAIASVNIPLDVLVMAGDLRLCRSAEIRIFFLLGVLSKSFNMLST